MVAFNLGFTGTREGMTYPQKVRVSSILEFISRYAEPWEAHHGDCVGSDDEFHSMAETYGAYVVVHPPVNPKLRAYCVGDFSFDPKTYFDRNRHIVRSTDVLLATPKDMSYRGGTGKTIEFAQEMFSPVAIVMPNGVPVYSDGAKERLLRLKEWSE